MPKWITASRTGAKDYNQDAVWYSSDGRLCVIADGAGGTSRESSKASGACVSVAANLYHAESSDQFLPELVQTINSELRDRTIKGEDVGATTFAAIHMVTADRAVATALGDSSIFLIRRGEVITQVRPRYRYDHIIAHGFVTQDEADSIYRNLPWWIQQQLGCWLPALQIRPTPITVATAPGDIWVLCSDGVTDVIPPQEIARFVAESASGKIGELIGEEAHRRGSTDDISCAIGYL